MNPVRVCVRLKIVLFLPADMIHCSIPCWASTLLKHGKFRTLNPQATAVPPQANMYENTEIQQEQTGSEQNKMFHKDVYKTCHSEAVTLA